LCDFPGQTLLPERRDTVTASKEQYRYFLKDSLRLTIDFGQTDQNSGIAPPPLEKPYSADSQRIDLAPLHEWRNIFPIDLVSAIENRRSHRQFTREPLTMDELSFLLWATQGIRSQASGSTAFRTVPSAGCRHALETYLCILNVAGLEPGVYRYLPVEHQLLVLSQEKDLSQRVIAAALQQSFIGKAAAVFVWTTIPYRMEWRYGLASAKVIALDAGHVCQNLYLASAAIEAGTCAVAAYHQDLMDALLGIDGESEFALYLAPVGKI
jgi:SagB-type dehydrogenase family enzyme